MVDPCSRVYSLLRGPRPGVTFSIFFWVSHTLRQFSLFEPCSLDHHARATRGGGTWTRTRACSTRSGSLRSAHMISSPLTDQLTLGSRYDSAPMRAMSELRRSPASADVSVPSRVHLSSSCTAAARSRSSSLTSCKAPASSAGAATAAGGAGGGGAGGGGAPGDAREELARMPPQRRRGPRSLVIATVWSRPPGPSGTS